MRARQAIRFHHILLLIGVGIIGIVALPFHMLYDFVSERLPGARDRHNRLALRRLRKVEGDVAVLVQTLAPGRADLAKSISQFASRAQKRLERHIGQGGWARDIELADLWGQALKLLTKHKFIALIDWRSGAEELQEALRPLLARRSITLDWSFVDAIEQAGKWEALKNEKLLPDLGERLAAHGVILINISDGGDAYNLALCEPGAFAVLRDLEQILITRAHILRR